MPAAAHHVHHLSEGKMECRNVLSGCCKRNHVDALFKIDDLEMRRLCRPKDARLREYSLNSVCHFLNRQTNSTEERINVTATCKASRSPVWVMCGRRPRVKGFFWLFACGR